ncbi:MAG: hydrolase [Opitutaceae bacterium]|nr:hydrolase [Opitutaceae bacterium]
MSLPSSIAALPSRAAELRELLIRWCNQNSGSDNFTGLDIMLGLLEIQFARLPDAIIERVPLEGTSARALSVNVRPAAPLRFLCSGHYDTVYGAEHPFQQCEPVDANTLRGPGVADMKGGLVVMLAALQAFEQTPHAARLGYEVLLSPDEEIGTPATAPVLADAARRHRFALVFEPARVNGDLVKSRMGTGTFTITCHGRAAHAGQARDEGRNAILELCELLPQVDALNRELPDVMVNIGNIKGGGPVNIVPDCAQAEINIRFAQANDGPLMLRRLQELAAPLNARDGYRVEISGHFSRPPKIATPAEEHLFTAWQACGRDLGLNFSWQHVSGGSDGNLLSAAGLPNLDGLGVRGDRLHSPDEICWLDSLVPRAQIAALFLHRLAAGEIRLAPCSR